MKTKQYWLNLAKKVEKEADDRGRFISQNVDEMMIAGEVCEFIKAYDNDDYTWPVIYNKCKFYDDDDVDTMFENYIKDTVEDELADIVIRTLSFIEHYEIPVLLREHEFKEQQDKYMEEESFSLEDFVGNVFICINCRSYLKLIAFIEVYCDKNNIDIYWHIDKKRAYNKIRVI